MKVIYEDDLYPGTVKKYKGKTIGEILEKHNNPRSFIMQFNRSNKYCLSDEVAVAISPHGNFKRGWQRN